MLPDFSLNTMEITGLAENSTNIEDILNSAQIKDTMISKTEESNDIQMSVEADDSNFNLIRLDFNETPGSITKSQKKDKKKKKHKKEKKDQKELVVKEELDDFDDYQFREIWQMKCWRILYQLFFSEHAQPFLDPLTEESMGSELYRDYSRTIQKPINFFMVKERMIAHIYKSEKGFFEEMNLVFDNAMKYNQKKSQQYRSAEVLKKELESMSK